MPVSPGRVGFSDPRDPDRIKSGSNPDHHVPTRTGDPIILEEVLVPDCFSFIRLDVDLVVATSIVFDPFVPDSFFGMRRVDDLPVVELGDVALELEISDLHDISYP
jgi:hypothetical protein